jgi:hypothetical protein
MALLPSKYATLPPPLPGLVEMYSGPSCLFSLLCKVAISDAVKPFTTRSSNGFVTLPPWYWSPGLQHNQ